MGGGAREKSGVRLFLWIARGGAAAQSTAEGGGVWVKTSKGLSVCSCGVD